MFLYIGNTANTLNSVEINHFGNKKPAKSPKGQAFQPNKLPLRNEFSVKFGGNHAHA